MQYDKLLAALNKQGSLPPQINRPHNLALCGYIHGVPVFNFHPINNTPMIRTRIWDGTKLIKLVRCPVNDERSITGSVRAAACLQPFLSEVKTRCVWYLMPDYKYPPHLNDLVIGDIQQGAQWCSKLTLHRIPSVLRKCFVIPTDSGYYFQDAEGNEYHVTRRYQPINSS